MRPFGLPARPGGPGRRRRARGRRAAQGGQAIVELSLVMPLMMIMLLGILDLARVYAANVTLESAARAAADFGAYNSSNWIGSESDSGSNRAKTLAAMQQRACVTSQYLLDYDGTGSTCANPNLTVSLVEPDGAPASGCDDPARSPAPCRVRVDIAYQFTLVAPVGIDLVGVRFGLPARLTLTATSVFAISDFEIDQP